MREGTDRLSLLNGGADRGGSELEYIQTHTLVFIILLAFENVPGTQDRRQNKCNYYIDWQTSI